VKEVKPRVVLDYGCGCGFFAKYAPPDVVVDTFDIGPYPQSGVRHEHFDLTSLWDVIEHVSWADNPDLQILDAISRSDYIAITTPVLPTGNVLEKWRHYKPGEHLTYFTQKSIVEFFRFLGFRCIKSGYPESRPDGPREDIISLLFKKDT